MIINCFKMYFKIDNFSLTVINIVAWALVYPRTIGIDRHMLTVNTDERKCSRNKWL
jgi:hypothetical protein